MLNWSPMVFIGDRSLTHPDLTKLLKKKALGALLANLAALSGQEVTFGLWDAHDEPLIAPDGLATDPPARTTRTLVVEGRPVGYLVASGAADHPRFSSQLEAAADLVTHLIVQAGENRALAQEVLERYREINLLYSIQETIGARLDLGQIADLILKESIRVIKAAAGVLLLLTPDRSAFDIQARHGAAPLTKRCAHTDTVAGWVVQNRHAAIVNDVSADPRCGPADAGARCLLCTPLTSSQKDIGALTLYDKAAGGIFTASDQKLLTALASQATVAIETAREVEARESRLKAQIRELRIEIDEIHKQRQVASITATDYFARLQQSAQEMRREFEEEV
jgi:hypothetical protein